MAQLGLAEGELFARFGVGLSEGGDLGFDRGEEFLSTATFPVATALEASFSFERGFPLAGATFSLFLFPGAIIIGTGGFNGEAALSLRRRRRER